MSLEQLLSDFSEPLSRANKVYVGFSGGMDSTLLLHALVQMLGASKVCALHVNHQLQTDSQKWQEHCRKQAVALKVEFSTVDLRLTNRGQGIEQEARRLRYEFFRKYTGSGDLLLLAHHADDQAETLLYRLFRGSGVRGLSAMQSQRLEGEALLLRPFLSFTREQLAAEALAANLEWIEDPSNTDINYDRNFIRSEILPRVESRWPAAQRTLARTASNLSSATLLLDEYATLLLDQCDWRKELCGYSFKISEYQNLSEAAQALLLATALRKRDLEGFDSAYPNKIKAMIESGEDRTPLTRIGESEMRRFAGRLYLMRQLPEIADPNFSVLWSGRENITLEGCGTCKAIPGEYTGATLRLSLRIGGERCKPVGRGKSQSLKKLMQEYALAPWLRDRTPLVWRGDQLVAVAGLFSCLDNLPTPEFIYQEN